MFDIPISVTIADEEYPIRNKGDYRMVLDCFEALNDEQLSQKDRTITTLIIFYDNVNSISDLVDMFGTDLTQPVLEMFKFFNCGQMDSPGIKTGYKCVDWNKDSQLIAGAVNNVAGKELRAEPYVHWWTFMGYYQSIGDCPFATIVSIRNKIKKHKKLEKYEQEFRKENPGYFIWDSSTVEERSITEELTSIWNSGG